MVPRYTNGPKKGLVIGESGVTIRGVDLGQMSQRELDRMNISDELKDRLNPYVGRKREDAAMFLGDHTIQISHQDSEALVEAKRGPLVEELKRNYNAAAQGAHTFDELPDEWQTAITSVAFQYGPGLQARTPNFWNQVVKKDWDSAIQNLRNFQDQYSTRRNAEANYIESAARRNRLRDAPLPEV